MLRSLYACDVGVRSCVLCYRVREKRLWVDCKCASGIALCRPNERNLSFSFMCSQRTLTLSVHPSLWLCRGHRKQQPLQSVLPLTFKFLYTNVCFFSMCGLVYICTVSSHSTMRYLFVPITDSMRTYKYFHSVCNPAKVRIENLTLYGYP